MNDAQIVAAIKKGDEASIDYAIDQYSKLLWSIAGTILKNVGSAEDIEECVADVFIHLWQKPEKFEEQRRKLKSYLVVVARSRATDRYRQLSNKRQFLWMKPCCLKIWRSQRISPQQKQSTRCFPPLILWTSLHVKSLCDDTTTSKSQRKLRFASICLSSRWKTTCIVQNRN